VTDSQIEIGKKIREIRELKQITINQVAKETGFTPSFISQFERGLTKASVSSLRKITSSLNIELSTLFEDDDESAKSAHRNKPTIIRKNKRKRLDYPDGKSIDYLLTNLSGEFEVIYSKLEPGGFSGDLISHNSVEECVIVLKGQLAVTIDNNRYTLEKGDTITFSSLSPHGWENIGEETLEVIWIVSPPSY